MLRAFGKASWLVALCGIGDVVLAVMNLLAMDLDGSLGLRRFALPNQVWSMSVVALVVGACGVVAGLLSSDKHKTWLLSLHGFALGAFGFIGLSPLTKSPLSFRSISWLFVLMTLSIGLLALRTARTLQSSALHRRFFSGAGTLSLCFAFSYVAIFLGLMKFTTPQSLWILLSLSYCSFAVTMLLLANNMSDGTARSRRKTVLAGIPLPT